MLLGRVAVILLTLLATVLALQADNNVLDMVAYAWAGFGATFGPVILLSLYWKEMNTSFCISRNADRRTSRLSSGRILNQAIAYLSFMSLCLDLFWRWFVLY